jgi:5,10-methylene-tetrahydrofolate dehydrogenase/methenyl tetrahydrofolate cyclohydrolase
MIYSGKLASQEMKLELKARIAKLAQPPVLAIVSVNPNPSIQSFMKIKQTYADAIGVTIKKRMKMI